MSGPSVGPSRAAPASAPPYGPVGASPVTFAPVGRGDLPLLLRWFSEPHVRVWWGPPEEELAAVVKGLDEGGFAMWIASAKGVPFAYVQDGPPEQAEEPYYAGAPSGWRAVDVLIGSPAHLGRGLAAPMMRAFAAHAEGRGFAGLLIDPDAANEPAVRAYRRAGFEEALRHRDADGEIIVMKMPLEGPA